MIKNIKQLGIVVPDMEKAIRFYEDVMGIRPINVLPREPESCELHGKKTDFQLKTGFAFLENLQIELIQVVNGRSAHTEFLEEHPEGGFHHVAVYVENLDEELEKYSKADVELIAKGQYMTAKWAYLDTRKQSGLLLELIEMVKRTKKKKIENEE